jgi:hypothetical protein
MYSARKHAPTRILRLLLTATAAFCLAGIAQADIPGLNLQFDQASYMPGDTFVLEITGTPDTVAFVALDTDPGPVMLPGIGSLNIGFSPQMLLLGPMVIHEGGRTFQCTLGCGHPVIDVPVSAQGVGFLGSDVFLSNNPILVYEDPLGICEPPACTGSISNFVFHDTDGNHMQDPGEPGIEGVVLTLQDETDAVIATAMSDENGIYEFAGLCAGTYRVDLDPTTFPPGLMPVIADIGGDDAMDSNSVPATVVLTDDASVDVTIDFGFADCGCCRGGIDALALRYNGAAPAYIEVKQSFNTLTAFAGTVNPGEVFSFVGQNWRGTFGYKIRIYTNGRCHGGTKLYTTCCRPPYPGKVVGDFEVVAASSKYGGLICPR